MSLKYKKAEYLLDNYKKIQAEIKNINIEIEEVKNIYIGTTSIDPNRESTSETNKITSSVENEVMNKEHRISYLESIKTTKENQIKKVDNALETLTKEDREFIKMRYFDKLPNWKVANILDITEVTCSYKKRRIIEDIKNILILY